MAMFSLLNKRDVWLQKHSVEILSFHFPTFFSFLFLSTFFLILTNSLTPYSFSTFFFSCLKHSSMRSWKGRRSSVTLFPWREIPPPNNGIYKYKSYRVSKTTHESAKPYVCMCGDVLSHAQYLPCNEVFEPQQFIFVLLVLLSVLFSKERLIQGKHPTLIQRITAVVFTCSGRLESGI